ncbi:hypothetical protein JTB14_021811, partial [Gonioctena quinquepunctata]
KTGFGPTDQEWGFATVRKGAHLFWWLHYTTANVTRHSERPLIIWLQGGPGSSSTGFGNFAEIGPLDTDLNPRKTSWVKDANLMFVDNPVGTGFSHADNDETLTTTNREIAEDFLELMKQFYETLPEFKKVPLYIFCESYGGKMTAEIALVIDNAARKGEIDCNLKGIGLGDSWISPIDSLLTWAPYLLNLGFIDRTGYESLMSEANEAVQAIEDGRFSEATEIWAYAESIVELNTYGVDFYNVLIEKRPEDSRRRKRGILKSRIDPNAEEKIEVIMNGPVREALNISRKWESQEVFQHLQADFMRPVTSIVEELLNKTDIFVAVYNGQLDLIVDTPGTLKWVENMHWKDKTLWDATWRFAFENDGYYQGYVKRYGNFAFYWVDRAGHMVPADNPSAMDYILKDVMNSFNV